VGESERVSGRPVCGGVGTGLTKKLRVVGRRVYEKRERAPRSRSSPFPLMPSGHHSTTATTTVAVTTLDKSVGNRTLSAPKLPPSLGHAQAEGPSRIPSPSSLSRPRGCDHVRARIYLELAVGVTCQHQVIVLKDHDAPGWVGESIIRVTNREAEKQEVSAKLSGAQG
jgi:hypothetical protein